MSLMIGVVVIACCSATAWNVAVLSPLLGVTWLFGLLAVNHQLVAFQYIFAVTNTLQVSHSIYFIFIFWLHISGLLTLCWPFGQYVLCLYFYAIAG